MRIYWYIDRHGQKIGTGSKTKRDYLAEQNYATKIGECDISEFDGKLI